MRVYNRLGLVSGCRGPPQAGDQQGDFYRLSKEEPGGRHPAQADGATHDRKELMCWDNPKARAAMVYFFYLTCESESGVAQLCPTLCDPMDCSLPGSSAHGIFQAIVLEWIAISFSRGSSRPRDQTQVSHIVDRRFTIWATACIYY